jgi:hypothetical protein
MQRIVKQVDQQLADHHATFLGLGNQLVEQCSRQREVASRGLAVAAGPTEFGFWHERFSKTKLAFTTPIRYNKSRDTSRGILNA